MKVDVTEEDLRAGIAGNRCYCPVARALKRAFSTENVNVNYNNIRVVDKLYASPPEVQAFVRNYDNLGGETPKPFSFEVGP